MNILMSRGDCPPYLYNNPLQTDKRSSPKAADMDVRQYKWTFLKVAEALVRQSHDARGNIELGIRLY